MLGCHSATSETTVSYAGDSDSFLHSGNSHFSVNQYVERLTSKTNKQDYCLLKVSKNT